VSGAKPRSPTSFHEISGCENASDNGILTILAFGYFPRLYLAEGHRCSVSVIMTGSKLEDVKCGDDGCQTESPENRECFPIDLPPNDPFFAGRANCLMFVRSAESPNEDCTPGFYLSLWSTVVRISVAGAFFLMMQC